MLEIPKKLLTFIPELFDSIAPQNAEIRTVAKSLPQHFQNFANFLLAYTLQFDCYCSGKAIP